MEHWRPQGGHAERHSRRVDIIQRHDVCVHHRIQSQCQRRRNKPHSFPVRQNDAVRRHRRCAMRQLLQQYRRRIPHEYQQLKLRRLGIIKYANGNLRYKPVKLFRHDHCGHPGSAPRGAEIRDEVHKQHRQQQRRKRGDGDRRLLFPVIGIRSIRVYHLRKQQRSQQTGAVFVLQRRKQQGQIQSQRDKHSRYLVAPFPVCQQFHAFRECEY